MEKVLIQNKPFTTNLHSDQFKNETFNAVHEFMESVGASGPVKIITSLFNDFIEKGDFVEMATHEPERARNMINSVTRTISFLTELYEKYDFYEQYLEVDLRMENDRKKLELKKETN